MKPVALALPLALLAGAALAQQPSPQPPPTTQDQGALPSGPQPAPQPRKNDPHAAARAQLGASIQQLDQVADRLKQAQAPLYAPPGSPAPPDAVGGVKAALDQVSQALPPVAAVPEMRMQVDRVATHVRDAHAMLDAAVQGGGDMDRALAQVSTVHTHVVELKSAAQGAYW